jgi:ATP-dependent DNA helicase RecQ
VPRHNSKTIATIAREHFGFEELRPGQLESIEALLQGHDTLVVQPTGSGKSAIYQITGLLMKGTTVIISPLIALQKDQVDMIDELPAGEALALNSSKPASEFEEALDQVSEGEVKYVFLAPEQLRKAETLESLRAAGVSLVVVDEAHCISAWGHDFRPDYLNLGHVIEALGHPRILALTATATRQVRDEIVSRLEMRKPKVFVRGVDRPNIYLRVDHHKTEDEKMEALVHRVVWAEKPGIVYAGTRKAAEEIMRHLSEEGVDALYYHAGLGRKERSVIQDRFMSGEAAVVVATNAFGMGIDKADIRFVYHFDSPESLDSYYQEIGRAGRDGNRSEAILFYRHQNIGSQSYKTGEGAVQPEVLEDVATTIAAAEEPISPTEVAEQTGHSARKIVTAIQRLEDAGAVEVLEDGEVAPVEDVDVDEAVEAVTEEQERYREGKRERLRKMQAYAEASDCRRRILLLHFEEELKDSCGFCDNCEGQGAMTAEVSGGVRREVV